MKALIGKALLAAAGVGFVIALVAIPGVVGHNEDDVGPFGGAGGLCLDRSA